MTGKVYEVPAEWSKRAFIDDAKYKQMYERSVNDPNGFWAEHAKRIDWFKPFTKVKNTSFDPHNVSIKWFEDGTLNVAHNCLDRHLAKRGDQVAIIWEGDDPKDEKKIVPALLPGGREEGADEREVHRTFGRAKAAGDFLTKLHHAPVAFGLIVGEGNGRIVKEAQRVLFARCEAQEEIVSGSARRTAAPFAASLHGARQWRLGLMEGEPFGENGVVTTLEQCDQRRLQRNVSFSCSVRGVTGAAQ